LVTWAGWVIPFGTPLVLVSSSAEECEGAVRQLIRIGYDDLRGYLLGGLEAWEADSRQVWRVPVMQVEELAERLEQGNAPLILDVRSDAEWRAGHLPDAIHIEAGRLPFDDLMLSQEDVKVVHCSHAYRSTVGISVLERRGYRNLVMLDVGYSKWLKSGFRIVRENDLK
jgi:hydroxyacylglutathione hydrolase